MPSSTAPRARRSRHAVALIAVAAAAALYGLAAVLMFFGGVWFLQGIDVLPGSFMTGQTKWALIGGATFVAGLALLVMARRGGVRR